MSTRRKFVQQFSVAFASVPLLGIPAPLISHTPATGSIPVIEDPADPSATTADILVDKLIDWKVELVFGLTGDGVIPIVEALRKRQDKIRYITVRHEEAAAFMASGYAKYTGKLGVCLATTGPGAVHLLNGLYDAKMEGAPVLAITGVIDHDLLGTQFTQEVDTVKMLQDVAVYNQQISGPLHAQTVVDLACRSALGVPGVAHITAATDKDRPAGRLTVDHRRDRQPGHPAIQTNDAGMRHQTPATPPMVSPSSRSTSRRSPMLAGPKATTATTPPMSDPPSEKPSPRPGRR
jgi:hypothetical protein